MIKKVYKATINGGYELYVITALFKCRNNIKGMLQLFWLINVLLSHKICYFYCENM